MGINQERDIMPAVSKLEAMRQRFKADDATFTDPLFIYANSPELVRLRANLIGQGWHRQKMPDGSVMLHLHPGRM